MDNTQLTFSHLLHLTAHHWRLAVNRLLKHQGMSQASWMAIAAIARQQAPLSQRELASELGVETASLVPLVNRLEAQGLIARELTASDRRKRLLVTTPQGLALYHQMQGVADDFREEVLAALSDDERRLARDILTRLLCEVQKR